MSRHVIKRTVVHAPQTNIILLSAGSGDRIKNLGSRSLLQIRGTTLLDHQLNRLSVIFPDSTITVVIGYESNKIIKQYHSRVRLIENTKHEETGAAASLRLAANSIVGNNLLIIHGDLWFDDSAFGGIELTKSFAVVSDGFRKEEVGLIISEDRISNFSYGLKDKWGQIAFLTGKELDLARSWLNSHDCSNKFVFECLNYIVSNKGKISPHHNQGKIIEIDNPKEDINAIASFTK